MLDWQFIAQNLNFAVNLFVGLVCFAMFWLTYDAWTVRKERRDLPKLAGFLLLAVGFLLHSTQQATGASGLGGQLDGISTGIRLLAYGLLAWAQLIDPLMARPTYAPDPVPEPPMPTPSVVSPPPPPPAPTPSAAPAPAKPKAKKPAAKPPAKAKKTVKLKVSSAIAWLPVGQIVLLPLTSGLVAGLYLRRATTGLERHLMPLAYGFGGLSLFELCEGIIGLGDSTNPLWYRLVQPGGIIWMIGLIGLLGGGLVLGRWVWQYLTKRIQSQLFMILVAQTVAIFLLSTVGFTYQLLSRIQSQSLADLTTASHVLDYAIASRQSETAAQADAVASRPAIAAAIAARDHKALAAALTDYLPSHGLTSLTVLDGSAVVLLRGEDPDRWGDSRSSDTLVRRSLIGEADTSVVSRDGVVAPTVTIVAATPVRDAAGNIVGVVVAGRAISSGFVDGVRASTGLDSAIYGGNVRAATTLVTGGGADRAIGIKETSKDVQAKVLKQGKTFNGILALQNRPYLVAYAPLKDVNNVPVGMVLVARPVDALYATANQSIELTFLLVVILLILSVVPVYYISRYLSRQLN
jgi:hypothetical protein